MEDLRANSPCELAMDELELLHRMSLTDDALHWVQQNADWMPKDEQPMVVVPYDYDEEMEACDPSIYDPTLFTPANSQPASPTQRSFVLSVDRDKPLPPPPSVLRASPPSTPRLTHSPLSTPPSSPRASMSQPSSLPVPRSRPPSTSMGTPRSTQSHATFPSISSTLSLLEERDTEVAKRSGVLVTEQDIAPSDGRHSADSTVLAHVPPLRRGSVEAFHVPNASEANLKKRIRPSLNLATSTSSPQLRALAELASIPASPISVSSPRSVAHKPSLISLVPSMSSPLANNSVLLPPVTLEEETPTASRWSMDSVNPDAGRPAVVPSPNISPSPVKPRKRGRLFSFITPRNRSGSLSKQGFMSPTTEAEFGNFGMLSPQEPPPSASVLSLVSRSRRTSHSVYPGPPIALAQSTSTASTTSSLSTLPTPADSQPDISLDPFCPASPTFTPASYLPEFSDDESDPPLPQVVAPQSPPLLPSTPSFLPDTESSFPFLSALSRRKHRKRNKKLVVTCVVPEAGRNTSLPAFRRDEEQRRRFEVIATWCERNGAVKRFERKPDDSLHVFWRDATVADIVSRRFESVIHIEGVGHVHLDWQDC